jgi:hypothetical protein
MTVFLQTEDSTQLRRKVCSKALQYQERWYTVKNDFPVPSRDVTDQTLPGQE